MGKMPKSGRSRKILTICLLQIAALIVAVCCVIAYMAHNDLSKGRWAFFIFICLLAVSFAIGVLALFVKKIPRTYPSWNWNIMLSIPPIILAILLLAGAIVISVHIDKGCMDFCALVTVAAVTAFALTFLFLFESWILLKKAKEYKSRREAAMVDHMETQTQL